MKLKIFAALLIAGAFLLVYSQKGAENRFAPAADFPRGALVYVQFSDLPAAVRLWNESDLKRDYLESENFKQFEKRHLALKLADRFGEFESAFGFALDAHLLAGASETEAAFAVYDIGKMEAVFIAPVGDAVFSASKIFQNREGYEEIALDENGAVYYRREIEIDRARQKQKFAFANIKGRLVLASSEKLLLQTIAVIKGDAAKNSLADEPDFARLAAKTGPHLATVWIDQTKLNDDYYFKHYWLTTRRADLKKFRAGMFDFEMREGKWIERREFLLTEKVQTTAKIDAKQTHYLVSLLPETVPFYKVQTLENQPQRVENLLRETLFERGASEEVSPRSSYDWRDFDERDFYAAGEDYDYEESFGEEINESEEETATSEIAPEYEKIIARSIAAAAPHVAVSAAAPQLLPAPLFAEFRRVLIFRLRSPAALDRRRLEDALAAKLSDEFTVGDAGAPLVWETKTENGKSRRELNLPSLGRGVFYSVNGDRLIFSNSRELLTEILDDAKNSPENLSAETAFDDLTVIRLSQRADAFDRIMQRIAVGSASANDAQTDFFNGNIGSLLDAAVRVERIEIKRSATNNLLREEISFVLK